MRQIIVLGAVFAVAAVAAATTTLVVDDFAEVFAERARSQFTASGEHQIVASEESWKDPHLGRIVGGDWFAAQDAEDGRPEGRYQIDVQPEAIAAFASSSSYARLSTVTGRLQLQLGNEGTDQVIVPCSAAFISDAVLLTAAHCLEAGSTRSRQNVAKAAVRVGYVSESRAGILLELQREPLEVNGELDFALFELKSGERDRAKAAGVSVEAAVLSQRPLLAGRDENQDLVIIGYVDTGPAQLIRHDCRVQTPQLASKKERFSHSCGTAPGVSGAPIFAEIAGSVVRPVVGIHQQAPDPTGAEPANTGYGVSIHQIMSQSRTVCELADGVWQAQPSDVSPSCVLAPDNQ